MRKEQTRPLRITTTKEEDGYTFRIQAAQYPGEGVVIEEVFMGESTHNAIDLLDPLLLQLWEEDLDATAAELREDLAMEALNG